MINPSPHFYARWGFPLLALTALLTLLPGIAHLPLLDRDEPRFAQATYEMMERGDWLIPTFNNDYRFDKPPLTYWWMAAHYAMLGKSEFGARLHSVISSLLIAWLLLFAGSRWFSPAAGFWAGFAWLTCLQVLIHGRLSLADMPMVLFVVITQILLYQRLRDNPDSPWKLGFWGLYLSFGLGFLAKGPIAWLVPLLSLLLWRWVFWRKPMPWKSLAPLRGSLVVLTVIGLWGIPALIVTGGKFWEVGMGYHVVDRGLEVFNNRRFIPGIYFLTAFFSLAPWIHRLPVMWRNIRRDWGPDKAFLVSWLLSPFLIFSFYATQLPHYTLPGFPAFFLLLFAAAGTPREETRSEIVMNRLFAGAWILLSVAALTILYLVGVRGTEDAPTALLLGLFAAAILPAALIYLGTTWTPAGIRRRSFILGLIALAVILQSAGQSFRLYSPAIQMGYWNALQGDLHRIGFGFGEPSLIFYTGSGWEFTADVEVVEASWKTKDNLAVLTLATEYKLEDYVKDVLRGDERRPRRDFREELDSLTWPGFRREVFTGVNFARGAWIELHLYIRDGSADHSLTPGPALASRGSPQD